MTFKSARALREALGVIPMERLLIETDCPYLAPVPHRGKRNEPAYVIQVAETIAQEKGYSLDAVATATWRNTSALFRLDD